MRIVKLVFETTPVSIDFRTNGYENDSTYKGLTIHQARRWYHDIDSKLFDYHSCPIC